MLIVEVIIHVYILIIVVWNTLNFVLNRIFVECIIEGMMQSYPPRALDRRLQKDWVRDTREDPRVLMSLRVDFGPIG